LISSLLDASATPAQKRAGAVLFALLVAGGIVSCAISSQAGTWANKDFERSREVAQIVNASRDPVVVSDFRTDRALGLAYYLEPRVPMVLALSCSECAFAPAEFSSRSNGPVLAESAPYENFFLLGPSLGLALEASRLPKVRAGSAHVNTIDVETFPEHSGPLNMFRTP
jgi:hypothetical protein